MPDFANLTPSLLDYVLKTFLDAMRLNRAPMLEEGLWLLGQLSRWHLTIASLSLIAGVSLRGVMEHIIVNGLKVMVFLFLLSNLDTITVAFSNTMVLYGLTLSGASLTVDEFNQPGRLVATGMAGLKPLFTYMENMSALQKLTNWWVVLIYAPLCWIAMLSYFLIGAHVILATIEFQLIASYGAVMVPWGVVSQTAFIAEAAIGGIISSAVRLGVLAFVTGLMNPIILSLATPASVLDGTDLPYWHALAAMLGALLMMLVSWAVPNFAASLLGGGPALTGQALVGMGVGAASGATRAIRRVAA